MKTEKQAVEFIAEELHVSPSELVFSNEVCPTCFNLLKESFFGAFHLISMMSREKAEESQHRHKWRRYRHWVVPNKQIPVLCGTELCLTRAECVTFTTSTWRSRISPHL